MEENPGTKISISLHKEVLPLFIMYMVFTNQNIKILTSLLEFNSPFGFWNSILEDCLFWDFFNRKLKSGGSLLIPMHVVTHNKYHYNVYETNYNKKINTSYLLGIIRYLTRLFTITPNACLVTLKTRPVRPW